MPVLDDTYNTPQTSVPTEKDPKTEKLIEQWQSTIAEAQKALVDENFSIYEEIMDKVGSIYGKYKEHCKLHYECKNFGMAYHIFENALPKLIKENPKAIKEFTVALKEDKNNYTQYKFHYAIGRVDETVNDDDYLVEAWEMVSKDLNPKTVKESTKKLNNIIQKYHIRPSETISESMMKLYDACDYLFRHPLKLTNLRETQICKSIVKDYIKEQKENKKNINNAESINQFNALKNECIELVNNTLNETLDQKDTNGLKEIKTVLENKVYNADTFTKDIKNLTEIKSVLLKS